MIQNLIVTLVALGAAAVIVRRVFGLGKSSADQGASCPSCASGTNACAPSSKPSADVHPLTLVRPRPR